MDLDLPLVFDSLPLPVCITDAALTIQYAHPEFVLPSPPDPADVVSVGDGLLDHVPENERPTWLALALASLDDPPPGQRMPGTSADVNRPWSGGPAQWRITASPLRLRAEQPPHVLFTCRELVARGQSEQLRREHEAARLDVARQLAVTLNHEINNPLFIVSATLEDLLADTSDPDLHRRLNGALDAIWRVSSAVKQLSEIRQLVSTPYIEGYPMIDLEASQESPGEPSQHQ